MFIPMIFELLTRNLEVRLLFFTHFEALPPYLATRDLTSRILFPFAITRA